jgi:proliferating cell nuclear antigen PCNA
MNISIKTPLKAEQFTTIFQHIKLFSQHVNVMFDSEKMYLQAMDGSHVSIFELTIPSKWFDSYTINEGNNICLGINSTILFRILNTYETGQTLNIIYDIENTDKLEIHFTNNDNNIKNVFDKHFELPLMDIENETMHIPDFESQADILIPSNKFANIINQLKQFGDTMDVECSEEKIMIVASSLESGKMYVEIKFDDLQSYSIAEGHEIKVSFGLSFLQNICYYSKIAKNIELRITENYPMKITYELGDDANIIYYIAPKINDD